MTKKHFGLLLVAALLAGLAGGVISDRLATAKGPTTVQAHRFQLIDTKGNVMAAWGQTDFGNGIAFFDQSGMMRALMALTKDGPSLNLFDESGTSRAGLVVTPQGPMLSLYDQAGISRISLEVAADGPGLDVADAEGHVRATLGAGPQQDESSLALFNQQGQVTWQTP